MNMKLFEVVDKNELSLEWISNNHRFMIWLDDSEAGWAFTSGKAEMFDMFGGSIDREVLTALYNQI